MRLASDTGSLCDFGVPKLVHRVAFCAIDRKVHIVTMKPAAENLAHKPELTADEAGYTNVAITFDGMARKRGHKSSCHMVVLRLQSYNYYLSCSRNKAQENEGEEIL